MRNLKKLLAVVVAICVLATFTIPAFAADETLAADTQVCADIGMLIGSGGGVTADYAATNPSRIQAAVMLLRLTGNYDEAAAFESEDNFADADKANWAKPLMAFLKANPELGFIGDGTNFMPNNKITAQEYYKIVLTALGYEIPDDYEYADTLAFAEELGFAMGGDVEEFTVNALATATVEGLKLNVKDGAETLAAKLVEAGAIDKDAAIAADLYADELKATVAATGAKKLTVTFNQAVDKAKATFEAKRGSVKPSVKAVTFAEDAKSAVIEFSTNMVEGDYTVTVSGLTEEAITLTTKVTAEKLTAIKFLNDVAVISGFNVTVRVVAENQYGEDVSSKLSIDNISASKGTPSTINKGLITINGVDGTFKVDETVLVTIVHAETGTVASKTLTIAKAVAAESFEFGELTTDDEELAKKSINVSNMTASAEDYYIPVVIKDQYGNTLDAASLTGVDIISSNKSIINPDGFDDGEDGTIIKLQTPAGTATHGTAVITVVSAGSGKTGNTTVVVKEDDKIDVLTLETPASQLKLTKKAELPATIINTYGEEVALKDVTVTPSASNTKLELNTNTTISAIGAELEVTTDYVKDKDVIKILPTAKNITLTVVTATGKSQILSLTAVDAPEAKAIKGLDKDFATMLANDTSLTTDLGENVIFLDQYGEEIDGLALDTDFVITQDTSVATSYAAGVITAKATAGTDKFTVQLKDGGDVIDELEVKITVVDADKITQFGIEDLNKFYTGAASAPHNQQIEIYGLYTGKKVVVNQNMIKGASANNGLTGFSTAGLFTASDIDTDGKDVAATVSVLVANAEKTYVVTKDVVYNDAAPKASELVVKYGDDVIAGGAIEVPFAELNESFVASSGSKLQFVAKDQYGVQRVATAFNFVVTNNTTADGEVTATGTGSDFVAGDAGDSLQLNVFVDGLYKSIKVFVTAS